MLTPTQQATQEWCDYNLDSKGRYIGEEMEWFPYKFRQYIREKDRPEARIQWKAARRLEPLSKQVK